MPFRPKKEQPSFAPLKGTLAQTKGIDNALYQTVQILIEKLMQFQGITVKDIGDINASINNILSITNITADKKKTYLTELDESLDLPNSRQLLAGTGVLFDDTVPNKRTVNVTVSGGGEEWEVLTNGDVVSPEPIYAAGDVIMCHTP